MSTFNEIVENNFPTLEVYTSAITIAHGKSHPEAFEVRELFEVINAKVQEAGADKPNLDEEFVKLRDITNNYTVPKNVCGTYEGTYTMLSEADKAYYSK